MTVAETIAAFAYACLAAWWAVILWRQWRWTKTPTPTVCDEAVLSCVLKIREHEKYTGTDAGTWTAYRKITVNGESFTLTVARTQETENA